jgi:DNA-binding HxlR family transcriptional regulator
METSVKQSPCGEDCPVRRTAQIIDGKWTTLIIRELLSGKKRYSDLQRGLHGISPKVLAARLRHLEYYAVISRTVYPTVPPMTEYTLTPLGQQLDGVIKAMAGFGTMLPAAETSTPAATKLNVRQLHE